jgi:hypothetical protein
MAIEDVQANDEATPQPAVSEQTISTESTEQAAPVTDTPAPAVVSTTPTQTSKPKRDKPSKRIIVEAVLVILIAALGAYTWSLHADNQNLNKELASLKTNPQKAVQQQTNDLIASVGKLIQLPKGETPTVAAVTDAAQAKKQSAFFNNAQNGDKVLLYVKAGEAILYRPSTNKIVLVAPLTFSSATGTTTKQ